MIGAQGDCVEVGARDMKAVILRKEENAPMSYKTDNFEVRNRSGGEK